VALGAGCGGDDDGPDLTFTGSDEEQVAGTVNAMTAAIAAGEGAMACALMTEKGQRVMLAAGRQAATGPEPVDDCEAAVPAAEAAGFDPGDFRVTVGDVSVGRNGRQAEAECDLGGAFILNRTDAGWRAATPFCNH
jgi:hypothetical protein